MRNYYLLLLLFFISANLLIANKSYKPLDWQLPQEINYYEETISVNAEDGSERNRFNGFFSSVLEKYHITFPKTVFKYSTVATALFFTLYNAEAFLNCSDVSCFLSNLTYKETLLLYVTINGLIQNPQIVDFANQEIYEGEE